MEESLISPENKEINRGDNMVTKAEVATIILIAAIGGLLIGGGLFAILSQYTNLVILPIVGISLVLVGAGVLVYAKTR